MAALSAFHRCRPPGRLTSIPRAPPQSPRTAATQTGRPSAAGFRLTFSLPPRPASRPTGRRQSSFLPARVASPKTSHSSRPPPVWATVRRSPATGSLSAHPPLRRPAPSSDAARLPRRLVARVTIERPRTRGIRQRLHDWMPGRMRTNGDHCDSITVAGVMDSIMRMDCLVKAT